MLKTTTQEKINKTTAAMQKLISQSKRKLLELEVLLSKKEIQAGNCNKFTSGKALLDKIR